ncbi:phage tail length tape measure family protein [Escherichia coli]
MDQIANLVIDLGIDAAEFKNEIPRIKNLLNGAASDAERSSARMQRFMERQTQAARQTMQAASSAATAASVHAQTVEKSAQAHERMAREVEQTRQRMEALSQKMREEQAQAMALAEAQDKAAAAFYRQIDSVKQASAGLQELQRIQQQIRQARNSGGIGQQDYLALISEVTAKTRVLTQAEAEATRQKVAFIRQLKEQATRQNLSSSELLRARAAQLGVSSAAEVYIRKMERAGKATHSLGLKSAAARQEIGVLIGELARGNLGALRGSGITLANRAGWIDTLMSPKGMMLGGVIGGITAAVYGLGKAWYDGQKEGEEFNRQLSLTGHYAGVTAGQLWTLSRAISGNGITQHAAAGALAQVVGSGAFRGNDIGMVARAAAQMERSVGQSISDTINQFKRLKDDPVNAAKALDNELHFLTATQLEQIRILGEQGRSSDAARIAMSALAEETGRRTADIDNNLNALGSTLQTLSDWWKQFWDAAMNIGREDSLDAQIATLQEKVSRAKRLPWTASSSRVEYDQQRLNELQEKKRQKDLQDAKEQAERNYQEQQKRRNAENAALNRMNETEAARHQREIARINAMQYADQAVRDAAIQRENERYEKALASGKKKTRETRNDEATRLLLQYSQQQAQVEGQIAAARQSAGIATDRMTEAHKQLLALQQRISDLDGKKLTADEKSVLARKDELIQALTLLDVKQQELQKQTALNDLKKKTIQLTSQLAEEERAQRQQHEGNTNISGVTVVFRAGEQEQTPPEGFESSGSETVLGTEVKYDTPITRTITSANIDRLRFTFGVQALVETTSKGDRNPSEVRLLVQIQRNGGWVTEKDITIKGKTTSQYLASVVVDNLPPRPFNIRMRRMTPDSTTDQLQNKTLWSSYTEIIDVKQCYPNTALVGVQVDSEQFGSQQVSRNYHLRGRILRVPSNYNPQTRQYSGIWDGTLKPAYSNNMAWCLWDMLTHPRYGMGKRLGAADVDKWALYVIGQNCDQSVPDGFGGTEPRITCNAYLTTQRKAWDVLSDFCSAMRCMPVWNGQTLTFVQDRPSDKVWTYNRSNVVMPDDGAPFRYSFSALKDRHNAVEVNWIDPNNGWETATELVEDTQAIARYGRNVTKMDAFGCTSRGQAHRAGLWLIKTELLETQTVDFSVGAEGLRHVPGDVIEICDDDYAGISTGGRVLAVNSQTRTLTLDREITLPSSGTTLISLVDGQGSPVSVEVQSVTDGVKVKVSRVPDGVAEYSVWGLKLPTLRQRLFRCVSIRENDDGTYAITAVQHVPEKEAIVDNGAHFDGDQSGTVNGVTPPAVQHLTAEVTADSGEYQVLARWDTPKVVKGVSFLLRLTVTADDGSERLVSTARTTETTYRFTQLALGRYTLTVRAVNAWGQQGDPASVSFRIAAPAAPVTIELIPGYFQITAVPKLAVYDPTVQFEFWFSEKRIIDIRQVETSARYLGTALYWIAASSNIKPGYDYYFYIRSVNTVGKSAFVEAVGRASDDAEGYLNFYKGLINKTHLGKELLENFELTEDNASKLEEFSKEWKDANDKWNAMWGVKIEQTKDGKHYVAGIGLSMEDTEEGKLSQFLVAANRIAFIDPANGNETPMFVAQGNQIFMNDVFLKRLTAPTITSGGSPPVFSLTSDGKLTAKNADISGSVNANSGTLNNVTINQNCTIKGMLEATQVRGDFVKAVSKAFPKKVGTWGNTETPNGTVTVTISDDHNFDRQIIIPPIIFNGIAYDDPGSGNNPGGTRYTGYGFEVRKNGVLIASRETKGAIPGSYSAVIDMPSGGGSVTLEFKIFQKGNQGAGNITDCTVIVTKKAASGISIR